MDIGFANNSGGNATHLLSINGGSPSTITYGSTGNWIGDMPNFGGRKIKTIPISLNAGNNTIRLTYGETGFAELDYIQLYQGVTRYQAETATVNHSTMHSNAAASNGQFVGNMDYSDSYVEFNVNAPTAGTYKLKVAFANGSSTTSTHNLSINGGPVTTVSYPVTFGWLSARSGEIKTITADLNAGSNTIKFSKGTGFAELDYIDIIN